MPTRQAVQAGRRILHLGVFQEAGMQGVLYVGAVSEGDDSWPLSQSNGFIALAHLIPVSI